MLAKDDFYQALFLHAVEAVLDLVLIRHEQRTAPLEGNADLDTREPARPILDDPPDRASHAAKLEDEDVDGREAAALGVGHDAVNFIFSNHPAARSCLVRR